MKIREICARPVKAAEQQRFQELMQAHHYLGALPKIGETLWYIALYQERWVALLSFSAAALKCAPRDQWIGWDARHQYARLKWISNNSRYLILPEWHYPNLGSRVLALCQQRLVADWQTTFGHPIALLETFVDPARFRGSVYRADNWLLVGQSQGFRRTRGGYSATPQSAKLVFLKPLRQDVRQLLTQPLLQTPPLTGESKMTLPAEVMHRLPDFFAGMTDPRRPQGRRHRLPTVLAIASAAVLCGMRGYKAIGDWAQSLGQKARRRFGCRWEKGHYLVPSPSVLRDVLVRVHPDQLDRALANWNQVYGCQDASLALDGKTMCNALDEEGFQTHILSAVGHQSQTCLTQKK